ncbi:MAG: hypothetical protein Q4B26_19400 [Eubacteriales bacterium]|nr:hypothetical protein [Eubacteriales bacterium]
MRKITNFEVLLDADDVLIDCNEYALKLLEEKNHCTYSIDHVTDWGYLGIPEDERLSFLNDPAFYRTQPAIPGAADFLKELLSMANVTIMTAVYPQFMGERIERLTKLFPFFPMQNIIMGHRKEMVQADVMLDDGVHNLLSSGASLPVLFRRPWNRKASGICCVNDYNDFLSLVRIMQGNREQINRMPKVLCIVGPSGSGKHPFADELCMDAAFEQVRTYTTAPFCGHNHHVTPEEFQKMLDQGHFLEATYFCSERYGLPLSDIDAALSRGKHAVAVMDISGCMSVYNHYPDQALILYIDRDKRGCVHSILSKPGISREDQVDRILAIDLEQKNRILADEVLQTPSNNDYRSLVAHVKSLVVS